MAEIMKIASVRVAVTASRASVALLFDGVEEGERLVLDLPGSVASELAAELNAHGFAPSRRSAN